MDTCLPACSAACFPSMQVPQPPWVHAFLCACLPTILDVCWSSLFMWVSIWASIWVSILVAAVHVDVHAGLHLGFLLGRCCSCGSPYGSALGFSSASFLRLLFAYVFSVFLYLSNARHWIANQWFKLAWQQAPMRELSKIWCLNNCLPVLWGYITPWYEHLKAPFDL